MSNDPLNGRHAYSVTETEKSLEIRNCNIERIGNALQTRILSRSHVPHAPVAIPRHDQELLATAPARCSKAAGDSIRTKFGSTSIWANALVYCRELQTARSNKLSQYRSVTLAHLTEEMRPSPSIPPFSRTIR
jgi:hypothetical protein